MVYQPLNGHFEPPAQDQVRNVSDAGRVVNYVWINKDPDPVTPQAGDPLCSVPLHYMDAAYQNAALYPDAQFIIWVDNELLNNTTRKCFGNHFAQGAPKNVEVRDLNEIPVYVMEKKLYAERRENFNSLNLWKRADLARVIVAEYCFEHMDHEDVIYSDFDVPDVGLNRPDVQAPLNNYGVMFGATQTQGDLIENGYMAFRRSKDGMKRVQQLLGDIFEEMPTIDDCSGFTAMHMRIDQWVEEWGLPSSKDLSAKIQPPSGTAMPANPLYIESGVNAPLPQL